MSSPAALFSFLLLFLSAHVMVSEGESGTWKLLLRNAGVSAMHMQLLSNDKVIMFDRQDFGQSKIILPTSQCDPATVPSTTDCSAHAVEYTIINNTVRPLMIKTDVWCSAGTVNPSGVLNQIGGNGAGTRVVRTLQPCEGGCDWAENNNALLVGRWYASVQKLPSGEGIIVGGRGQFNFEFYPKATFPNLYSLPFLSQTNDKGSENNLYPYTILNTDGNLFIFANNRAILLNYKTNTVVKTYPAIPGGEPRSYPSTGSAVLLPLRNLEANTVTAEVLVCGGAPNGSYAQSLRGTFVTALDTCARITITDPNPTWVVEKMPMPRCMGDMVLLPHGDVLIINGAGRGTAGWEQADTPVKNPVVYKPDDAIGSRFESQNPATIARMYHSTAILLRDGRVLVGGSNPHEHYNFTNVQFPTEVSLDTFLPSYLNTSKTNLRPTIDVPVSNAQVGYAQQLVVRFWTRAAADLTKVKVTVVEPSFATHSFSMNQRLLVLTTGTFKVVGTNRYEVSVTTPKSAVLAPPGYYLIFVVHQGVPSVGNFLKIQ
uniref:Galactose oxidase n=1 Tax=Kalanchoe fedtschenkoi TaxID=63787 RepID=A0A7N0V5J4_KALFE